MAMARSTAASLPNARLSGLAYSNYRACIGTGPDNGTMYMNSSVQFRDVPLNERQRLVINLNEGQGRMEGRVKSIFTPQRSGQGTN